LWICINNFGNLVNVELKKIEYEIIKREVIHNFYAIICNTWNHLALQKYTILLVGRESRIFEIYVDGNLWSGFDLAVTNVRVKIKGLIRKKDDSKRFVRHWVADKTSFELWSMNIKSCYYCRYLTVWSKVPLSYALEIWDECTKRFPKFDWILRNNKSLKKSDLSESIICYKDCGVMYLRGSVIGWDKIDRRAFDLNEHWKRFITEFKYWDMEKVRIVLKNFYYENIIMPGEILDDTSKNEQMIMCKANFRKIIYEKLFNVYKIVGIRDDNIVYLMIHDREAFYCTRVLATDLMYKIEKMNDDLILAHEKKIIVMAERCKNLI
jgi:hypothetical protein